MRLKLLAAAASLSVAVPAFAGAAPEGAAAPKAAPPAAGAPANAPKPPAPPTEAELKCRAEAKAAVEKLRDSGQFKTVEDTLSDQGPLKITTEYVLPNRMRQVVSLVTEPKPVETIVIDRQAWSNTGEGWEPLAPDVTQQLVEKMAFDTGNSDSEAAWNCHSKLTVEGKEMTTYIGVDPGPKDVSPGAPAMAENQAGRYLLIDPASGLPARGIFAKKDQLDKPIFKTVYSYPKDLKIEAPAEVK